MKLEYELVLDRRDGRRYLGRNVGLPDGELWTRVRAAPGDGLFERIAELEAQFGAKSDAFVLGWRAIRTYSRREWAAAEVLRWWTEDVVDTAGEDCGTVYVDPPGKDQCGAHREQLSALQLPPGALPKRTDFAVSYAGEFVAFPRFVRMLAVERITGAEREPIYECQTDALLPRIKQLVLTGSRLQLAAVTDFGASPFASDAEEDHGCACGRIAGLNVLSEVSVPREAWMGTDIVATSQLIGRRSGGVMPHPLYLCTRRFFEAARKYRVRGLRFEIAHFV